MLVRSLRTRAEREVAGRCVLEGQEVQQFENVGGNDPMHLVMAGVTAPSHVYPGLAVISELVSRGHRVSYVVGHRLAGLVAATGAEVIGHESIMPDADEHLTDEVNHGTIRLSVVGRDHRRICRGEHTSSPAGEPCHAE